MRVNCEKISLNRQTQVMLLLSVFMLLFAGIARAAAVSVEVSIEPAGQTINTLGQTSSIDVQVDLQGNLSGGMQANLAFDPDIVEVNHVIEGNLFQPSFIFNEGTIDNLAGTVINIYTVMLSSVSSSGTFVSITLTSKANGISPLTLSNIVITDETGAIALPFNLTNGSVTVAEPPPTPTFTSTPTATLTATISPTVPATPTASPTATITSAVTADPTVVPGTSTYTVTPTPGLLPGLMVDRNWLNPDKGDELKINLQQLPANEEVTIKIYNAQGVMVRALITGQVSSGQITWSGRNANDQKVASGVYLIRIDSASMHKTIRVAIVR